MKKYDAIIIGAGSGGLNTASFLSRIGLTVLLVERRAELIGGDCLNFGCVPSKALLHVSRLVRDGERAEQFGFQQGGEVDIERVMQYVQERQDIIRRHENADHLRKKGIDIVFGEAAFLDKQLIAVGDDCYAAKRIILATGSRPRTLSIPGSENLPVYTNETIFSIKSFPRRLLVVGGGPIGFEIGQAFARLGSEVVIVNKDDQWLAKETRAAVAPVMEVMRKEGVQFIENAEVTRIEKTAVVITTSKGEERVTADALFLSIGRIPNTDLALDRAGIETDKNGKLILDAYLRTTNPRVFAIGDVAGLHQFTHAAELHASLIISNMFTPRLFWKKLDIAHMAWVTYTDPEIATFGRSEEALRKDGVHHRVVTEEFAVNDRSIADGRTEGFASLFVSPRGRVLGGTVTGKDAGELAGELILAMHTRMPIRALFARISPYPTRVRINRLLAASYLSTSLTPSVKWFLRKLY